MWMSTLPNMISRAWWATSCIWVAPCIWLECKGSWWECVANHRCFKKNNRHPKKIEGPPREILPNFEAWGSKLPILDEKVRVGLPSPRGQGRLPCFGVFGSCGLVLAISWIWLNVFDKQNWVSLNATLGRGSVGPWVPRFGVMLCKLWSTKTEINW